MEPSDQLLIELEKQERWRDLLGEVLAVLNRDGGHYQTKHGAGRAAIEGIRSHYQMLATIDALQADNERLRKQVRPVDVLQARIDAATVLIRQAMEERHYARHGGAAATIPGPASCHGCAPFRAWLAGGPCPICGNAGVDAQGYECSCKEERQ